jgi:hypothetical protein
MAASKAKAQAQMEKVCDLPDGRPLYFASVEHFGAENSGYKVWDEGAGQHLEVRFFYSPAEAERAFAAVQLAEPSTQLDELLAAIEKQQEYTRMCVEGPLNTQLRDLYSTANRIRESRPYPPSQPKET